MNSFDCVLRGSLPAISSFIDTTNLVAYYRMEDANDSFGTNHGTGTSISYSAGKNNNAGLFDGTNSIIQVTNNSNIDITSGSFSMSCWVYCTNYGAGAGKQGMIITKQSATVRNYRIITDKWSGPNLYSFGATIGGTHRDLTITGVTTSTWYHLVGVYDASAGMKFYINGNLNQSNNYTGTLGSVTNNLSLGKYIPNQVYTFAGLIDEVGLWKRALTQSEVTSLYNSGAGLFY